MGMAIVVDREPLREMNTTPLIDVMLVLLIMFIMTIPVATHVVEIPLPSASSTPPVAVLAENRLSVTPRGAVTWNGTPIDLAQLQLLLAASRHSRPEPLLRFEPDGNAPYGMSAEVLHTIKQSGIAAFGFSGNERFREFGKAPAR